MLLNLTIVHDYIKKGVSDILQKQIDRRRARTLKYPAHYMGETLFRPECLYIAQAEQLTRQPDIREHASILCLGYPPAEYYRDNCDLLCFFATTDIYGLMNQVLTIFSLFQEYEYRMETAAQQKDPFPAIGRIGLEIFRTPISAFDRYDKILFQAFDKNRPEFLNTYLNAANEEYSSDEERSVFMADKEFIKTYETHGPAFADSPIYGTSSIYMNIFEGNQYMGRILIEDAYRPFQDSDYSLVEWLAGYIQDQIIKTGKFYFGISKEFETMMRLLILENNPYLREYGKILEQHHWNASHHYQCIHICEMGEQFQNVDMNKDAFYLRELFDSHYILVYEYGIIQVINLSESCYSKEEILRRLQLFLTNNNYIAGISTEFQDFSRIWEHSQQAMLAAGCHAPQNSYKIYDFNRHVLDILLRNARGNYSGRFFRTNAIEKLFRYDEENHADLVKTLKCYLKNNLSATKTQETLHIARTTCLYRIQRIEELTHLNLREPDVQLYIRILFRLLE